VSKGYRDRFSEWLPAIGAATRTIPDLLDALCRFLNVEGYHVFRCNLATEAVHPLIANTRHVWFVEATDPGVVNPSVVIERRQFAMGEAMVDEILFNVGSQTNPQYLASPFYKVEQVGELYEPNLSPGQPQPFPVFDDLAAQGCTGYYARRLSSFSGLLQKFGVATRRPGGLDAGCRADLRWTLDLFTLHLDTLIENLVKETLARSYVGVDPGRRVCDGMIARGAIISTEAAVWFSDLRGFTTIGDTLDQQTLVQSLNDYFDAVVPPIYAQGGEVLKYIGDAVLAVFPHASYPDPGAACRAALAAVGEGNANLKRTNARRGDFALPLLNHGIGLSSGSVSYGNIGARERLDFTVIGAAVNLASRIEGLTKTLREPVLCSEDFAALSGVAMRDCGGVALKGIALEAHVFAPPLPAES
jgi:adenylate cyclase